MEQKQGLPLGVCVLTPVHSEYAPHVRKHLQVWERNSILDDAAGCNAANKDPYKMEAEDGTATEEEVEEDSSSHL